MSAVPRCTQSQRRGPKGCRNTQIKISECTLHSCLHRWTAEVEVTLHCSSLSLSPSLPRRKLNKRLPTTYSQFACVLRRRPYEWLVGRPLSRLVVRGCARAAAAAKSGRGRRSGRRRRHVYNSTRHICDVKGRSRRFHR